MTNSENIEKIKNILRDVFPKDKIPNDIINLQMGDTPSWDSLGNFNLILTIETQFGIRFSIEQISEVRSVSKILEIINTQNE